MATAGWNYRDDGDEDAPDKAVTTAGSADEPVPPAAPATPKAPGAWLGDAPIAAVGDPPAADDDRDLEGRFMDALRDNAPPVADDGQPLRPTPPSTPPPSSLIGQILGPSRSSDTRRVRSPSPVRDAAPSAISTTRPKKRPKQLAADI